MSDRIKYRINSAASKVAVNTDTFIKIDMNGTNRLLPTNDLSKIISSSDVFNRERQNCDKYRLLGTIKPIISNVLFNITEPITTANEYGSAWTVFNEYDFRYDYLNNPDTTTYTGLTYLQSCKENLKELNGWFGFYDPALIVTGQCMFHYMEPKPSRFSFIKKNIYDSKNWELTITYPYTSKTDNYIVSDISGDNGLKIIGFEQVNVGGRQLTAFSTPVKHNLKQGDRVKILNAQASITVDGVYRVVRLGLDNGDNKEYYFCVEIESPVFIVLTIPSARMRRIVNGFESRYYIRMFKKVKTVNNNINNGTIEDDDYEIYNTAFAQTIYSDEVPQFVVNEDINVSGLTDNLNRPLTELYLTIIKNHNETFFTNVQSGIECGFTEGIIGNIDIPDIHQLYDYDANNQTVTYPSPTPLNQNVKITDDDYYGDIIEYNPYELIEHTLADVGHRFNTLNRINVGFTQQIFAMAQGPRHEGYYYKPHYLIKIRDFSNYVEQGDANTDNIPDYAENLGDGRYLWRDLLDIGVNDGQYETVNHPFVNNAHYVYQNYCFPVRRQDPNGRYGLLYYGINANEPFDVIGIGITDIYEVNSAQNAC